MCVVITVSLAEEHSPRLAMNAMEVTVHPYEKYEIVTRVRTS